MNQRGGLKMERIRASVRGFLRTFSDKVELRTKTRDLMESLGRMKRQRVKLAKWLFEKLLGSFLISVFILYGSLVGLQVSQSGFQTVYSLVTLLSVLAYALSVVLIPSRKANENRNVDDLTQLRSLLQEHHAEDLISRYSWTHDLSTNTRLKRVR